jgi:protein subunit release factor A
MKKLNIEFRPGVGGDDAKLLVKDIADYYIKMFDRLGWKYI